MSFTNPIIINGNCVSDSQHWGSVHIFNPGLSCDRGIEEKKHIRNER